MTEPILKDYLPRPRKRTLDDVPQRELFLRAVKIFIAASLAWDYAETALDLAAQRRLYDTKKLCREIRALRADYDRTRAQDLDREHIENETDLGLLFERVHKPVFDRLFHSLMNEVRADGRLSVEDALLAEAVLAALTTLDALSAYAGECDAFVRDYYPSAPHSMLPEHLIRLRRALPGLLPGGRAAESETRRLTAKILLREIRNMEVVDDGE